MAYTINNSDSSKTFTIQDSIIDSSTLSVDLIGQNASGYGPSIAKNFVQLLENFASASSPSAGTKLIGQLWFDKTNNNIKVFKDTDGDGTGDFWVNLEPTISGSEPAGRKSGEQWYDTKTNKLHIHDGSNFKLAGYGGEVTNEFSGISTVGSPTSFGTKLKTIFLNDNTGKPHAVLALVHVNDSTSSSSYSGSTSGETIMLIVNHDEAFTLGNSAVQSEGESTLVNYYPELSGANSIGTSIVKGLNLRGDYTESQVALASRALQADSANALLTGSNVSISANDIIHTGRSYIPDTDVAYTLGDTDSRFLHTYTQYITVGNGSSGDILANGSVRLGTSSARFADGYFANIDVSGNVVFGAGSQNIGSDSQPAENLYAGNIDFSTSLTDGSITITGFIDEDSMGTDSAVKLPTQQSVKAYVDNTVTGINLGFAGDSGSGNIDLDSQTFNLVGGNNITTNGSVTQVNFDLDTTLSNMVAASFSGNVSANFFVGTATQAQYADLAENYQADSSYEPGTVVVFGGSEEVTISNKENNPSVAGVVSTEPAHLMNAGLEGDGVVAVALRGRIPCKVYGPVRKGDVLIASSTPGHAKAAPFKGYQTPAACIIGKAISDHAGMGEGVIEVLV